MRFHLHHAPHVLEASLLDAIVHEHGPRATERTLIVVPTRRLVEHLLGRLTERRPAWLGLEVHHLRSLALAVLDRSGAERPALLSSRVVEELLIRAIREVRSDLSTYVERRPGAVRRLAASFRELREAGIKPRQLEELGDPALDALAPLFRRFVARLDGLAAQGWVDDAALIQLATERAAQYAGGFSSIHIHGLYDPIAVHLELLQALGRTTSLQWWFPHHAAAPAYRYARRRREQVGGETAEATTIEAQPENDDLAALYDERERPEPSLASRRWDAAHAQGPDAEIDHAVGRLLSWVEQGASPRDVLIVGRDLQPYGAALEAGLDGAGLEWSSSLGAPLRREPAVRDVLQALELVVDDFPRRPTAEWLRSPRIDWEAFSDGPAPPVARAEGWSRQARIVGGLEEWTEQLCAWAEERPEREELTEDEASRRREARRSKAASIGRLLTLLRDALPTEPAGWSVHAGAVRALIRRLFPPAIVDGDAVQALWPAIDEMEQLAVVDGDRAVPLAEARRWLEAAVGSTRLPVRRHDSGGVRVLDAMQARGLTARHVIVIGMNAGAFPRPPREDPFLPDRVRARLSAGTGRTLALKGQGGDEERLLLALTVGAAAESVAISWQRADESGRERTPSMALRELARLRYGEPDYDRWLREAHHVPSHPAQAVEDRLAGFRWLTAPERRLLAALHSRDADRHRLLERFPELAPGVAMLLDTQAFVSRSTRFDGRIGPRPIPRVSATGLEQLGRCPQQYLFGRVLRVQELDAPADPFQLDVREVGLRIHDLLEAIYRQLEQEGFFEVPPPSHGQMDLFAAASRDAAERARQLLRERAPELIGAIGQRLARRLPLLWEQVADGWLQAIERFLDHDLERIADEDWNVVGIEERVERTLDLGDGMQFEMVARFDRLLERDGRLLVGDYKTAGNLDRRVDPLKMLRAETLQVPLYRLLAGDEARVALLGVGPAFPDPQEAEREFLEFENKKVEQGFLQTLRILHGLLAGGAFPLNSGTHCRWCPYAGACRRNHPPTQEREHQAEDSLPYRRLREKVRRAPLLDLPEGSPA